MRSNSPEVARRARRSSLGHARTTAGAVLAGVVLGALAAAAQSAPSSAWWAPGQGTPLPGYATYENERGHVGLLNMAGPIDTKGHPFFEPIGTNGRACVSCHQPSDGMALSLRSVRERWTATGGTDPLFAAVDGMNCPNLPAADARSHSLLLERGLFRIALPWPPTRVDGTPIEPEFTIEVVRDPSGCNTDPVYGLRSATPTISVFRRPRPVANTKYTTHQNFGVGPFVGKNGMPTAIDPETGRPTSMNLMADARVPTLAVQAADAASNHLQVAGRLTADQIARIVAFERPGLHRAGHAATAPAVSSNPMARRRSGRAISRPVMPACSATTRHATSSRSAASGPDCPEREPTSKTLATRRASRSHAVMTCSCSARSGSGTRCT